MTHYERSLDIRATPQEIWAVLGRFMDIHEFAPLVTSVDALTDGEDGVGSKRLNHFDNGTSITEEVTHWEPNHMYRVRLSDIDAIPLHRSEAEISIASIDSGHSRVTWSTDYQVKYGVLGWLLGQTLLKIMMKKIIDANLHGLADQVQSK